MAKVTMYKNWTIPDNPSYIDLDEFIEGIRDGTWEDIVYQLRLLDTEEKKKAFKSTMPTVSMSGEFTYRSDKSIIKHNGFIAIDIDGLNQIEMSSMTALFPMDSYVYAAWVSAGGSGFRILFKVDPKNHDKAFQGLQSHLFEVYRQVASFDPNGKNVSKPYIVSYDPHLYINRGTVSVFKNYVKEVVIKNTSDIYHTAGDLSLIVKQLIGRGVNICEDYNSYLKVGFALAEQFGEDGRNTFHELSKISSKYLYKIVDKQFDYCLKARGTTKVGISTLYYLAKEAGISISSEQTKKIVRYSKNGKKAGLSKEQISENLKKFEQIEGAEALIEKVYESKEDVAEEENMLQQLEMFISTNYNLKMNEVTGYLEQSGEMLPQGRLNSVFIAAKKVVPKIDYQLMMRLLKSDFVETYNPFFNFFGSDGIPVQLPEIAKAEQIQFSSPLIDKLSKCIINKDPQFTLLFLRKWLVGIVSAAHKVHSPLLLCLLGAQNSGKTEFFRRLFPKELSQYYAESKLDKEKDDELLMTENLVIMDDEFGGKTKTNALKLKNLTSKQWFSVRRPYGDHNEKILRLAVLCGTSNYYTILTDDTGNRRVIPIEVEDIDKVLYNSIDKKELFLECFRLYKEGFDWRISSKEEIDYLNKNKEKYTVSDKEEDIISKYFMVGDECRMSSTEIMIEIEALTKQKTSLAIIGRRMTSLGFDLKTTRTQDGKTPKKWAVKKIGRDNGIIVLEDKNDLPF